MSMKGKFSPRHPEKYKGNAVNIIYRSSWELKLMSYLDSHPDVLEWASEEFCIPYLSPVDGRVHRYFPDFFVRKRNELGFIESIVVEVKPEIQVEPPKVSRRITRRYINEVKTYGVNTAKWKAAKNYCETRGWKFIIMTEKSLGIKK